MFQLSGGESTYGAKVTRGSSVGSAKSDLLTLPPIAQSRSYRGELTINGSLHLRARDYDAHAGTFTRRDPLPGDDGRPTVANAYHYSWNDPLNVVDPSGMHSGPFDDCDASSECNYVVRDVAYGHSSPSQQSDSGATGRSDCYSTSPFESEIQSAAIATGMDQRMIRAIYEVEAQCLGQSPDWMGDHGVQNESENGNELALLAKGHKASLGPTNMEYYAFASTMSKHGDLFDKYFQNPGVGDYPDWLWTQLSHSMGGKFLSALATGTRLRDLSQQLDEIISNNHSRVRSISLRDYDSLVAGNHYSHVYFQSTVLGVGWFGGGRPDEANGGQENSITRMSNLVLSNRWYDGTSVPPDMKRGNGVYGKAFCSSGKALGMPGAASDCPNDQ
jgi:RHS repeat-associated protein